MTKVKNCKECGIEIGLRSKTLLCKKDRVKKWVAENRERSNGIKRKYVETHQKVRTISISKYNNHSETKVKKLKFYLENYKSKQCPDCNKIIYYKANYCASCFQKGERASNWQGGITPLLKAQRNSIRKWSLAVRKRDGKCLLCSSTNNLHADHIKPFSKFPELRNVLSNGRTLCATCHYKTETFGGRISHA